MRRSLVMLLAALGGPTVAAEQGAAPTARLVARRDIEQYKPTIKALAQFGERRPGTDRNRAAVTWIEAQLRSYGCADVARLKYDYQAAPPRAPTDAAGPARDTTRAVGGGRYRGIRAHTGVNTDSLRQPDRRVRALDAQATTPGAREEVYCTKVGSGHPGEMYIVGAHMDGHGWGEAANDDGSGTALVMQLARVFSAPDVRTDRSIRFILWNNEETGLNGARAYVEQRQALQGKEDPAGSGRYPEPKALGRGQHDLMLFDHGIPRADGLLAAAHPAEADVKFGFQSSAKFAAQAKQLAWTFQAATER